MRGHIISERYNNLDILTAKGQASLEQEREMIDVIKSKWNISSIETDKPLPAKIDGMMYRDGKLLCIYESKCRNMSYDDLKRFGSWLVTYEKISSGIEISKALCVPYFGFLYCLKDKRIVYWKITDNTGDLLIELNIKKSKTQATINGGSANKVNSYLSVNDGKLLGL